MDDSDQSNQCSIVITLILLMVSLFFQAADRLSHPQITGVRGDRGFQSTMFKSSLQVWHP